MTDDELIAKHVEFSKYGRISRAFITRTGTPIWALIGYYLQAMGQDAARTAADYDITTEEMDAALAYYRKYQRWIDGFLLLNEDD